MARKPNRKTTREGNEVVLVFRPHEFQKLKHNEPGPSGKLGGYPRHENFLLKNTDPETLRCPLAGEKFTRTIRYCKAKDNGGPNKRIREACIPALRREGIELLPEFSASYQRRTSDAP